VAGFIKSTTAQYLSGEGPLSSAIVALGCYTATASAEFGAGPNVGAVEAVLVQTEGTSGQSIKLGIEGYNPAADSWECLIESAASASATTCTLVVQVDPSAAPITNASAQRVIRRRMRVIVNHADTKNVAYSISLHGADT
jgi:hypothetical protein